MNVSVCMANDRLNHLFSSVIDNNYPIRSIGRPILSAEVKLRTTKK